VETSTANDTLERTGDHRGHAVHEIDCALDGTEWLPCLVVGFLALATVAHAEVPKIANLDAPGTLETLKRDNPDHFRRVVGVVEAAAKISFRSARFGELMRASFEVKNLLRWATIQTV